jgi:hypothetical protein
MEFPPGWLPVDEQAGLVGYLVFFGQWRQRWPF